MDLGMSIIKPVFQPYPFLSYLDIWLLVFSMSMKSWFSWVNTLQWHVFFMVVICFNKYSWNVLCQLFKWVLLLIWKRKEKWNPLSAMSEQQFCWAASSPINHHHPSVSSQLPLLLTSPTHNLQYALIKNLTSNKSLLLIPAHEKQNRRVKLFEIYPILF